MCYQYEPTLNISCISVNSECHAAGLGVILHSCASSRKRFQIEIIVFIIFLNRNAISLFGIELLCYRSRHFIFMLEIGIGWRRTEKRETEFGKIWMEEYFFIFIWIMNRFTAIKFSGFFCINRVLLLFH